MNLYFTFLNQNSFIKLLFISIYNLFNKYYLKNNIKIVITVNVFQSLEFSNLCNCK